MLRYSRSKLANLVELLPLWRRAKALDAALRVDGDDAGAWGAWKARRGLDGADPCVRALDAQLSWVLSAALATVDATPAAPILRYARGLRLGVRTCVLGGDRRVVRVAPSVAALQAALARGLDLRCGRAVAGVRGRAIAGEVFDAVVVATPPGAVRAVVPDVAGVDVFDAFGAETRAIAVHRDASLMPRDRRDWRALNVAAPAARAEAAELTVWLNAYYPERAFAGDVFMTWNARREPADRVAPDVALPRVVQSPATPRHHAAIAALQGAGGVFFAGAHAVPGLGLLEQAVVAGENAAEGVLGRLRAKGVLGR